MKANPVSRSCDKWTVACECTVTVECTRTDGCENSHYGFCEAQGGQVSTCTSPCNGQHNSSNLLRQDGKNT